MSCQDLETTGGMVTSGPSSLRQMQHRELPPAFCRPEEPPLGQCSLGDVLYPLSSFPPILSPSQMCLQCPQLPKHIITAVRIFAQGGRSQAAMLLHFVFSSKIPALP